MVDKSKSYSEKIKKADFNVKLILIGDSQVGKTSVLLRYCDDFFNDYHISTVAIDYKFKTVELNNLKIKMQIYDTAGQERFKSMSLNYYKGSDGIINVFDLSSKQSFYNVINWANQIKNSVSSKAPKYLIGNKCDDVENRKISREEAEKMAQDYDLKYFETSAKKDYNIKEMFDSLIMDVYKVKQNEYKDKKEDNKTIKIDSLDNNADSSVSKCKGC